MKLSTLITPALFIVAGTAARETSSEAKAALDSYNAAVENVKVAAQAAGCDWVACISSLASYGGACALAAAQGGLNIPLDLVCLASIGTATASCRGCP
ncbi:hypothetical protein AJ79_00285 [Helicocarpus griseus UAMH5409]|uniref:Fungal calcium binding protein domain-containing protein n=1 Tax=Helicocarpus griseus UAMH5409 TaxID=1447875 RepID=A0A2B7YCQ6_9EURO|nr:hypothetical protein AJ79_00285 [Helicocarpus griseus UAMH5409]